MAVKDKITRGVKAFERLADQDDVDAARALVEASVAYWTPEPLTPGIVALVDSTTGHAYVTVRWSVSELEIDETLRRRAARV